MVRVRKVLRYDNSNKLSENYEEVKEKKDDEIYRQKTAQMFSIVAQLGYSISLPIAGGAIIGSFLDNKFASSPRITLSLIFLGLFLGIVNIYTILKNIKE